MEETELHIAVHSRNSKCLKKTHRSAWENSDVWMRSGELQIRWEMNYRHWQDEEEGFPLPVTFSFTLF